MGAIKEFYHDEICKMSEEFDDIEINEEDYQIEKEFEKIQNDLINSELPSFLHPKTI